MEKIANLTHVGENGFPAMVHVGEKNITRREATAQTQITLPSALGLVFKNGDLKSPKGPVLSTAIVAGTMAVKKTSELIPFCHPLSIEDCKIDCSVEGNKILIRCLVKITGKTGVEMEALTGASVTALTIYDMCKSAGHDMTIGPTKLIAKSGGKNDFGS